MRLFPDDRRFEEAGRDPELCEKLLKDLQRGRRNCLIGQLIVVAITLLVGGWLVMMLNRGVQAIMVGAPPPAVVDWLLPRKDILLVVAGPLTFFLVWNHVSMVAFDTRIKMLLFLRARQDRPS